MRVGLRVNNSQFLERVLEYLPPGSKPSSSPVVERLYSLMIGGESTRPNLKRFHLLYANIARVGRSTDLGEVLQLFESHLQYYIAEAAPRRVFVHAGVVGWRGQAILIPGRSLSGKTTLVAELVRAGATYYSDEYAVLDQRGRVHPYARRLSIRRDNFEFERHAVETLGGSRGIKPLPVGLVVVTRYSPGARWRPRSLSAGQGALALLDNTVSIQRQPEVVFPVLKQVASRIPIIRSARGEAGQVVDSILATLE